MGSGMCLGPESSGLQILILLHKALAKLLTPNTLVCNSLQFIKCSFATVNSSVPYHFGGRKQAQ